VQRRRIRVWADIARVKELIGVLPDWLSMPERLTGCELLRFTGLLRDMDLRSLGGVSQDRHRVRVIELL
jgi:ABC-2 type transport system ATP-binding protein